MKKTLLMNRKGFTLIELLIVVAIIAILAAIAVPNFLEAQTRAKVSRGKADMRAVSTAIESYKIDTNNYPPDYQYYQYGGGSTSNQFANCVLGRMTTPVSFMASLPTNVYKYKPGNWYDGDPRWYGYKADNYWRKLLLPSMQNKPGVKLNSIWSLFSVGPDETNNCGEYYVFGEVILNSVAAIPPNGPGCLYDPTNGTVSAGDIVRCGP
ncbi:MAG: prepilin-type N-terminal cleavage/methylation domain-containing protein [bacterium]